MKTYVHDFIFLIPIIGEIYLLILWAIRDEYPLKYISSFLAGIYQGIFFGLLIAYILIQ